jgi:hypothetical protein
VAHDWEVEVIASFFNLLYSLGLRRGGEDKLCKAPPKRGLFDVRSFYNVLVPHDGTHFSWKSFWRSKAPLRSAFCAWLAYMGKTLTVDNLRKQHIIVVN